MNHADSRHLGTPETDATGAAEIDAALPRRKRFTRSSALLLGAIAAALVGAALLFKGKLDTDGAASALDPLPAKHTVPVDQLSAQAQPIPVQPAAGVGIAPEGQSSDIDARLQKVEQQLSTLIFNMEALSTDIARVGDEAKQARERADAAQAFINQQRQRARAARTEAVKRAQSEPVAKASVPAPQILSVDSWGGQPSVVVRHGQEVRFVDDTEMHRAGSKAR